MEVMYVGRRECGCITAASYNDPSFDLKDFTLRMTASGRTVECLPLSVALKAFNIECPHISAHINGLHGVVDGLSQAIDGMLTKEWKEPPDPENAPDCVVPYEKTVHAHYNNGKYIDGTSYPADKAPWLEVGGEKL